MFASLKRLKKHAFILFTSVEKLKNYGDNFCKLKKHKVDFFYMLEKAQKHGFGSEKNSKNMNIIFASLKTFKKA